MTKIKTNIDKRALIIAVIIGVLFGSMICAGYAADTAGELLVGSLASWIAFLLISLFSCAALYCLLIFQKSRCVGADDKYETACASDRLEAECASEKYEASCAAATGKRFFLTWLIIFACWIPVFLAVYPGFFVYDATDEYIEVATRVFNTHHPLLHVLFLGGSVCAGNKLFGDVNIGIALFILVQMVFVSAVFAWITYDIKKKAGYVCQLIWYGVFPTVVMFALCSVKDTLFSAFMLIAVVSGNRVTQCITDKKPIVKKEAFVLLSSLFMMMLMRHNGVYAVAVMAVIALIYCIKGHKLKVKYVIAFFVITILAYKLIDTGLVLATHAQTSESQEILTVPIQQIARCWRPYKDQMSDEERQEILTYIPEDALSRYTPNLSDPVKVDFNNDAYAANKVGFFKIWLRLFLEHPLCYINAWIDTSYGYYYPWAVVNVYEGHEVNTFTYTESSYFGYEVEYPGERTSVIPEIDRVYRWLALDDDIQKLPVVHLFFSMGALFWIYVLIAASFIYNRKYSLLVPMALPALVWLTLLLGPTFLPRYTVFLWFILPVYIRQLLQLSRKEYN